MNKNYYKKPLQIESQLLGFTCSGRCFDLELIIVKYCQLPTYSKLISYAILFLPW